jgi:hypothetical protein
MNDETPPRRRRWIIVLIALVAVAGAGAAIWWAIASDEDGTRSARTLFTPEERAPAGVRIRVEILNATATPRLAQSATRLLRDRGFDVVSIGNNPTRRDSTLVLDRTNHPEWARLVASVLGRGSAVAPRPDSSRYVDITVLLGADWTPPSKAFDP